MTQDEKTLKDRDDGGGGVYDDDNDSSVNW